jgi:hypothetical protein
VELNQTFAVPPRATRVVIHLTDEQGRDRGIVGEAEVIQQGKEKER